MTVMCWPGPKLSRSQRSWEAHCTRRTPAISAAGATLVLGCPPGPRFLLETGLELGDLVAQLGVLLVDLAHHLGEPNHPARGFHERVADPGRHGAGDDVGP